MQSKMLGERKKRGLIVFVMFFVVHIVLFHKIGETVAQTEDGVNVRFAISEPEITLHEPTFIEFSIYNGLTERMQFDLGPDRIGEFEFLIIQPDKSKVRIPNRIKGGISLTGRVVLDQKEAYTQRLLLGEWYNLKSPGKYIIKVIFTGRITTMAGKTVLTKSWEEIQLQALPINTKRLKNICASLTKIALKSSSVAEVREAVLTLSHIQVPIAVPYLEQVLKQATWGKRDAIAGLGRIGNKEALKILTTVQKDENEELKEAARVALGKKNPLFID